jgi:hypothetical protein
LTQSILEIIVAALVTIECDSSMIQGYSAV